MKPLYRSIAVLTLSAASLSAFASLKPSDVVGEAAQTPSTERAIYSAVADRTIAVTGGTKWVNVNHYEVVRFVSNGREFTWYFDGVAQPGAINLSEIAPAGFVDHKVSVYVALSDRDFPG